MKKKLIRILLLYSSGISGQVGINTIQPHPSAALDLDASSKKGGLLIPRVNLLSITDVITITNPANGLLVYNISNNGSGNNQVYANYLYYYDQNQWKRLTNEEDLINNNLDLPHIVASGRKENSTSCNTTANNSVAFALETDKIKTTQNAALSTSGQLTAPKTGYYAFSVSNNLNVKGNPGQSFTNSPYITSDGVTTYTTRFRGDSGINLPQPRTITGVVYLLQGEQSNPFYWNPGSNTCVTGTNPITNTTAFVGSQEIVWEYLGN